MNSPTDTVLIEVCVDSVESAIAAQAGGAVRVELCDNLFEGGTTPSIGMVRVVRQAITMGLHIIIRPRGGDFLYSDPEMAVMRYDVEAAKAAGADGVVIGLLLPDGQVDQERTAELVRLARPMRVTFHRAFDMTRDPYEALDVLIASGVERVLTSGQEATAWEGIDLIQTLVRHAADRIIIMPGGGVTDRNVARIIGQSGVREVHTGGSVTIESLMDYRNTRVSMGRTLGAPEFTKRLVDKERIRAIGKACSGHDAQ